MFELRKMTRAATRVTQAFNNLADTVEEINDGLRQKMLPRAAEEEEQPQLSSRKAPASGDEEDQPAEPARKKRSK